MAHGTSITIIIFTLDHTLSTGGTKYRAELHALWEAIHVLFTTEREFLGTPAYYTLPSLDMTKAVGQKRILR
jgi:hypothetical protein